MAAALFFARLVAAFTAFAVWGDSDPPVRATRTPEIPEAAFCQLMLGNYRNPKTSLV
jgi:hypothetical protein